MTRSSYSGWAICVPLRGPGRVTALIVRTAAVLSEVASALQPPLSNGATASPALETEPDRRRLGMEAPDDLLPRRLKVTKQAPTTIEANGPSGAV